MKVIVCGAGQVGSNIARHLASENNDVTVIDTSAELIQVITDQLDVKGIVGHASSPDVLEQAGASDTDMLVAVTLRDEVNMVACQVAHSLFNVPTKIARVRRQAYLKPIWADLFSRHHLPIDVIISPEIEVARAVTRQLHVPGALELVDLADGRVKVIGVRCQQDCPVVNTPLRQLTGLFPDLNIVVVAVVRGDRAFVPSSTEQLQPGDDVYFTVDANHVARAMAAFGHEEREARRIIIVGGGNIGLFLASQLEAEQPGLSVKVIEADSARAEYVARQLTRFTVLEGDALDADLLEQANVGATETVVTVTNDDETNILAALLAKRHGCQRAVTLVNKTGYIPLVGTLGIDVVVSPRALTVSTILQHVRRGRIRAVHSLRDGFAEVIEAEVLETSGLVGRPLRDVDLPAGVIIGAVIRDDAVILPHGDMMLEVQDRVIVLAIAAAAKKVEKLFSVRLEFF